MLASKKLALFATLAAIAAAIWYLGMAKPGAPTLSPASTPEPGLTRPEPAPLVSASQTERVKEKSAHYSPAAEIASPSGFINAAKFSLRDLAGKKVVLLDFWTYSCINCIREIPYIKNWYEKYRDQGLEIVGMHAPEFEFEHDYNNVSAAVKKFGIKYPVVLDNDYGTWNAYRNQYWPRLYLVDIDGFVVYDKIGEGGYDATEARIRAALKERMDVLGINSSIPGGTVKVGEGGDLSEIGSPETYFGSARNDFLKNGASNKTGEQTFAAPASIERNSLYLSGTWDMQPEFAENESAGAKIIFRYKSKGVYLVGSAAETMDISVTRDGKPLGTAAGADVDKTTGTVRVSEDRLYKLIDDPSGYGEHALEITIPKPGLRVFTLTFG